MAARDAISATIDATGAFITVTFESMAVGGTVDVGLGASLDPSGAKLTVTCTSPSFSNAGVAGTASRTVVGLPDKQFGAVRNVYPNHATPNITNSGGNAVIRFALSDFIYQEDTSVTLSVGAGLYTVGGNGNNATSGVAVTNNSTDSYSDAKCLGNWAVLNRLVQVGTSLYVEFVGFNRFGKDGKPLACVVFTVTDQHAHTTTATVTEMSVSPAADYNKVLAYAATISLSSMTDGDLLTISAKAYPWYGVAASCLDTNDGANTYPTPLYTNLVYRYDAVGDHGHACVDATNGVDGTGVVYASRALAEAGNAYLTLSAALTALAAYNNTNAGHNDCGGGNIYCKAGSYTLNSSTAGGAATQFVTIQPATAVTQANVSISAPANSSRFPDHMRLKGVTVPCAGTNFWSGNATDCLVFEECNITTAAPTSAYLVTGFPYGAVIRCTGLIPRAFKELGGSAMCFALIRGNSFDRLHLCNANYTVIGNKNIIIADRSGTSQPFGENMVLAFNFTDSRTLYDGTDYIALLLAVCQSTGAVTFRHVTHGLAVVQNIFVRYGAITVGLGGITNDGCNSNVNNLIFWNNQTAGGRINMGYADGNPTGADDSRVHKNWSMKNNIFGDYNCKTDVFASNANNIGNWPNRYWVGGGSNFVRSSAGDDWRGDCECGLWSKFGTVGTPLEPLYVDDHSRHGTDSGPGGDYHLQAGSPAKAMSHDYVLPFDLEGNRRNPVLGSVGAYEGNPATSTARYLINGVSGKLVANGVQANAWTNGQGKPYVNGAAA